MVVNKEQLYRAFLRIKDEMDTNQSMDYREFAVGFITLKGGTNAVVAVSINRTG